MSFHNNHLVFILFCQYNPLKRLFSANKSVKMRLFNLPSVKTDLININFIYDFERKAKSIKVS